MKPDTAKADTGRIAIKDLKEMSKETFESYSDLAVERFLRMNGLIATFSFGGAGGVFAPSLSSGASFGALIAQLLQLTGDNANLLILIGMTAFLTGVTRAPFTSAIIIFEMTDRHSIIFFLLLGAVLASLVCNFVTKRAFYDVLKEKYIEKALNQENIKKK